jgi:hypothetical protein
LNYLSHQQPPRATGSVSPAATVMSEEQLLVQEKLSLYSQLKTPKRGTAELSEAKKESFYAHFNILKQKRRKHQLVDEMLWRSYEDCEVSCEVVLSLVEDASEEELGRWRAKIINERILVDMIQIVKEWMARKYR